MIDTHCHLDSPEFDTDREIALRRASENGVVAFVVPSIDSSNLDKVLQLSQENQSVFCAIGIHPHSAGEFNPNVESRLVEILDSSNSKIVAIGEIGLDYYYDFSPREKQIETFRRQLHLAKRYNLPAIIHNRNANEDLIQILEEEQDGSLKFVLHCFSQDVDFLRKALDLQGYVSFTGNITFKNSKLAEVVEHVPIERFFLETDSPYMAPVPYRGKRNEPARLPLIAQKISEIKGLEMKRLAQITTENAKKFFNLVLILLIMFLSPFSLPAQEDEYEEIENPYKKFIGIGTNFGFNTLVIFQSWNDAGVNKERSSAYEGKFFYGASLNFSPIDFNINRLEMTYTFDRRYSDTNYPDLSFIYRTLTLTSIFLINPSMRVNFYGGAGLSYIFNSLNLGHPYRVFKSSIGFNFCVGFMANIPIQGVGLFTLTGEWLMIFDLSNYKNVYDVELKREVDAYYYYSQPRLVLSWYPEFLNSLR